MKIQWVSNHPEAPSGYGSQTRQVGLRIAKAGYDIEFVANDGTRGDHIWNDLLIRGSGTDRYSRDTARDDLERSKADWVIALYDAWIYSQGVIDPFKDISHVAGWVPVDHYPAPPVILPFVRDHAGIAMSRYGFDRLTEEAENDRLEGLPGFDVWYAPHAVDDVFTPTVEMPSFGQPFRTLIGVPPDAFLFGIVAANTNTAVYDRKGFGDMIQAAGAFMREHPDAYLYLHTLIDGIRGIDLRVLLTMERVPDDRIRWVDQYLLKKGSLSDEDMAAIYSGLDVLLMTSRGEGFGLPALESLACGTPAILSNWTAQPELLGLPFDPAHLEFQRHPAGWLVDVDPDWDPHQGAKFGKPRIGSIILALREAYAKRGDQSMRQAAFDRASAWRADLVFDTYWRPILADMEAALRSPNRQERRKLRAAK